MSLLKLFGSKEKIIKKPATTETQFSDIKYISLFIVDDNESFANLLSNHLVNKEKGKTLKVRYNITKYTTGEECLANLHTKPDIILLDYFLSSTESDLDGDVVFKKIMEFNPQQKVVMLSGQEESTIVLSLIKMGLRDYIMKDDEMFEQLQHVLLEVYNSK